MPKYTKVDEGKIQKLGNEYSYVIEIAQDKPTKKEQDIRLRIVDEKPIIKKIRTRYDPEITLFGDKKATMNLTLGYNIKELKNTTKWLLASLTFPFVLMGTMFGLTQLHRIPSNVVPEWSKWILIPLLFVLVGILFWMYFKANMKTLAQYLKARDLKKTLEKEGFKKE